MTKMKILKTILIISIAVFSAGFLPVPSASAVSPLVVEFEQTPLFNEVNFLPGEGITRWVKVTNESGQPQRIAAEAINYPGFVSGAPRPHSVPDNDLSRALAIIIKEKGGNDLYGGSTGQKYLYDFYQTGEVYLSDISTGGDKTYEFEIIFPSEKKDEWQTATTTFDILIGFQGAGGGIEPGEGSGGGSGGGGGGGGGGGWLPPGLTIKYEKDIYLAATTAIITWDTSYSATSQVIYDTAPGKFNLNPATGGGPANYGYALSKEGDDIYGLGKGIPHQVTLTGLSSGITYYFRCVSHGSLAISGEHSFTTLKETAKEELSGEQIDSGETSSGGETVSVQSEEKENALSSEKIIGEEESVNGSAKIKTNVQGLEENKSFLGKIGNLAASLFFSFSNNIWLLFIIYLIFVLTILIFVFLKKKNKTK